MTTRRTCMVCGHYCWLRCRYCGYVRPLKHPPRPDHKRKIVMGVQRTGLQGVINRTMSSRKAAIVLGAQKGGLAIAAAGTAHRWTSETARKAAIKSWTKRRKFNKRIQARVGMVSKKRSALWREPLRAYYAEHPTRGVTYLTLLRQWHRVSDGWGPRVISERAALQALGHLKSPRGYIPDTITPVPRRRGK